MLGLVEEHNRIKDRPKESSHEKPKRDRYDLTQQEAMDVLDYNKVTGEFLRS